MKVTNSFANFPNQQSSNKQTYQNPFELKMQNDEQITQNEPDYQTQQSALFKDKNGNDLQIFNQETQSAIHEALESSDLSKTERFTLLVEMHSLAKYESQNRHAKELSIYASDQREKMIDFFVSQDFKSNDGLASIFSHAKIDKKLEQINSPHIKKFYEALNDILSLKNQKKVERNYL